MYRSRCKCIRCRKVWTTRKRRRKKAPERCPRCHSSRVILLGRWTINTS